MALAFGHFTDGQFASGTLTFAHTATGDDILFVFTYNFSGAYGITGVTYAGAAMTALATNVTSTHVANPLSVWYKLSPASGSNNVVISQSASATILGEAVSYSGSSGTQFGTTVLGVEVASGSGSFNESITTTGANSWVVMFLATGGGTPTSGSNTTVRGTMSGQAYFGIADSGNLATSGAKTLNVGDASTEFIDCIMAEILVAGGGGGGTNWGPSLLSQTWNRIVQ
jgi:hypothetical protein